MDPSRVLLGVASNFGARMVGPGHAEHKSMKMISMGEIVTTGGQVTPRLKWIEEVQQTVQNMPKKKHHHFDGRSDFDKICWGVGTFNQDFNS